MELIGLTRYKWLKSQITLTDKEKKLLKNYEENQPEKKANPEFLKHYMSLLNERPVELEIELTAEQCYKNFLEGWETEIKKELILSPDMVSNLKFLNRYFTGGEISCFNEFNSNKGLLLVGGFGNAKTSAMRAYRKAFELTKGYSFKILASNDIVEMYERCQEPSDKTNFWNVLITGRLLIDDLLSERMASNYGKAEILKDVLEKRYDKGLKTYVTMNTRKEGDIQDAIEQIAERYGERLYDRVFEMFNVFHWKGKSMRK